MRVSVSEAKFQKSCLQLLALAQWPAWRIDCGLPGRDGRGRPIVVVRDVLGRPARGFPDVLFIVPAVRFGPCSEASPLARMGFLEIKRPAVKGYQSAGKLSEDQEVFLQAARDMGCVALVADTLDVLQRAIRELTADPFAILAPDGSRAGG